jgi:hypothetical protein
MRGAVSVPFNSCSLLPDAVAERRCLLSHNRFSLNGKASKTVAAASPATGYQKNEVDLRLDRVSDLWRSIENALLSRAPGRDISVVCDSRTLSEPDENGRAYYETDLLGIQRCAGKWRVSYQLVTAHGRSDWRPILECDWETRSRMALPGYIGQLRAQVEMTRSRIIPALDTAIDNLETALAALEA